MGTSLNRHLWYGWLRDRKPWPNVSFQGMIYKLCCTQVWSLPSQSMDKEGPQKWEGGTLTHGGRHGGAGELLLWPEKQTHSSKKLMRRKLSVDVKGKLNSRFGVWKGLCLILFSLLPKIQIKWDPDAGIKQMEMKIVPIFNKIRKFGLGVSLKGFLNALPKS